MKTFKVLLHRDYIVNINTNNEKKAKELAEYYIGNAKDESTDKEREQHNFRINEIEMVTNDAFEVEETNEDE